MIADVVFYTTHEGGQWLNWKLKGKPTNPELITRSFVIRNNAANWISQYDESIVFHSLKLSDGAEWDVVNGFRRKEWEGPH